MKKVIVISLFLLLAQVVLWASECYHYHTKTIYKIVLVKGSPFLEITVMDPNGISMAHQRCISILQVGKDVKMINRNGDNMLLMDDGAYYLLAAEFSDVNQVTPVKIAARKDVQATFDADLLYMHEKWFSFSFDPYVKKITKTATKLFPDKPIVLAQFQNRRYLLKDDKHVYCYEGRQLTAEIIEGLNPATIQCLKLENNEDKYLLTDGNTAYIYDVSIFDKMDITESLLSLDLKRPFTIKEVARNWLNSFVDFNDGNIWCYVSAGLDLQDGTTAYLYPVKAQWLNKQHELIDKEGKIYYNGWDLINDQPPVNLTAVAQPRSLEITASGFYFDGTAFYKDQDGAGTLEPVTWLSKDSKFVNGVYSYQKGIPNFFDDGRQLIFDDNTLAKKRTITHQSTLKDLKLAYAYDDKLLIENKEIPNSADRESMELLGSTVDVIEGCDGGRGQIPVVIEYNYFFRDKNHIYIYHSGDQALRVIKAIPPHTIEKDNYEQLRELQKKMKN
ncbi:hypothetical protein D3C71_588000 [compost metagenome]